MRRDGFYCIIFWEMARQEGTATYIQVVTFTVFFHMHTNTQVNFLPRVTSGCNSLAKTCQGLIFSSFRRQFLAPGHNEKRKRDNLMYSVESSRTQVCTLLTFNAFYQISLVLLSPPHAGQISGQIKSVQASGATLTKFSPHSPPPPPPPRSFHVTGTNFTFKQKYLIKYVARLSP